MQQRRTEGRLVGSLNSLDTERWNPYTDPYIEFNYSVASGRVSQKKRNKAALLEQLGATQIELRQTEPLIGFIGRLVTQKGVDLITQVIPELLEKQALNFVLVGAGEEHYENAFRELAQTYPDRVFVHIGYSEALAHQVEAGADMFLMPSRFEPCGLNQMYSLAYGTPPIVHYTGGLIDTVINASDENVANKTATGFVFYDPTVHALRSTIEHALFLYSKPRTWQQIQKNGMSHAFDWQQSAQKYI